MNYSALKLAEYLDGKLQGNPDVKVTNIAKIQEANKDSVTFLSNKKYTQYVHNTKASIIVVDNDFNIDDQITPVIIRVENAYIGFVKMLHLFNKTKEIQSGISELSNISESSDISNDVYIGSFSTICSNTKLHENVKVHENVFIVIYVQKKRTLFSQ